VYKGVNPNLIAKSRWKAFLRAANRVFPERVPALIRTQMLGSAQDPTHFSPRKTTPSEKDFQHLLEDELRQAQECANGITSIIAIL
jgi:hypothetical protein